MLHILVIDDDERLRTLLKAYLTQEGMFAATACDASEARTLLKNLRFDLAILDVMMPGESGLELATFLRQAMPDVPILMLTARGDPEDRITGLEAGVDDYLAKPFEPRELILRIEAILRRTESTKATNQTIHFGTFTFELPTQTLSQEGEAIYLTSGEAAILHTLAKKNGNPVPRTTLAQHTESREERSVDVQINRLRKKIEPNPKQPRYIQTVRGTGYALKQG